MRVLFTAAPWRASYFPMVPVAWALATAGHDVAIACSPGFADAVVDSGLPATPVMHDLDLVQFARFGALAGYGHPDAGGGIPLLHPVTGEELPAGGALDLERLTREALVPLMDAYLASIASTVDFARHWRPDLVVTEVMCPDGIVAARALGVPAVWQLWGPVGAEETDPALRFYRDFVPKVFARHGLPAGGPLAAAAIDICPDGLGPGVAESRRLPVRYVPYTGPAQQPDWLAEPPRRPRIGVVCGTSLTRIYGSASFLAPTVVEAVADLDVEVVVALADRDRHLLGELPDNVRAVGFVPLEMLAPTCRLVAHHGGSGSTMTAVAAGVPHLTMTFAPEQDAVGERLAAAGVGRHLPGRQADAAAVRTAVRALLADPTTLAAARRMAAANAARPTPAALVADLERLAAA